MVCSAVTNHNHSGETRATTGLKGNGGRTIGHRRTVGKSGVSVSEPFLLVTLSVVASDGFVTPVWRTSSREYDRQYQPRTSQCVDQITMSVIPETREPARVPADVNVFELIEEAKEAFYDDPNVIGVGFGPRRKGDEIHDDEITLVVYVKEKLPEDDVDDAYLIPEEFEELATDVVAPFGPEAPKDAVDFVEGHQLSEDMGFVDWERLHEQWTAEAAGEIEFHGTVQDFGDVCVIEDDGTLTKTIRGREVVDWVQAYKLFQTTHDDIYDFVTFVTDSDNGMPPQGGASWYRHVHNDVSGIGLPSFSRRSSYDSDTLQGIIFMNQGHFPIFRYVMLQEQGHRWGCFAKYRDSPGGSDKNDHLLHGNGHWARTFDDDRSPMDYDRHDWVQENGDFKQVSMGSEERSYCDLDLYLMGLMEPDDVGDFYLLSNLTRKSGNLYSADKNRMTAQNIKWAEGTRSPSYSDAQKLFKHAFVVLTGNTNKVHDLANQVDFLRLRFQEDFYEATKTLGQVDTTLGPVREDLTPAEVRELTSGNYTGLHQHQVRPEDLRITGTQYRGALDAGNSQRLFTHSWPTEWVVDWSVRPTTDDGKVDWSVDVERDGDTFTYWITVRNVGSVRTNYELKYSITR